MPIYAYRCESCGFEDDVLQKMSDAPLTTCPQCHAEAFRKQVTAAGFQLKGSGWYVTDFRDNGKKAGSAGKTEAGKGQAANGQSGKGDAGKGDGGSADGGKTASGDGGKASATSATPSTSSTSGGSAASGTPSSTPTTSA